MNKIVEDMANRLLKRRPDGFGPIESRVLQSTLERDRIGAAHDYEVNLKAEIMALHEKLDELRHAEIIGMRDEILRMAEQIRRIDEKLSTRPVTE